jgi:molybdopterin/thiamine biosynthesis adenylyltransferase
MSDPDLLQWRPRLRDSLVIEQVDGDLMVISTSDQRVKRFTVSGLVLSLIPMLTGRHTVADLIESLCHGSAEAAAELCSALLVLRDEHLLSKADDPVAASRKLSREHLDQYDRQIRLFQEMCDADLTGFENGSEAQEKLSEATVLVCGVGGLGSMVATSLAAAGAGHLILCDTDIVERSNLTRQYMYSLDDIGTAKVGALTRRLSGINSFTSVQPEKRKITGPADLADLLPSCDLVISCADDPSVTDMAETITAACWPAIPHIVGGAYSYHVGILGLTVIPKVTACWYCLLEEVKHEHGRNRATPVVPRSGKAGVLGAQSGVVANLLAWEAIRLLTGMPTAMSDRWTELDYWSLTFRSRALSRRPDCPQCSD